MKYLAFLLCGLCLGMEHTDTSIPNDPTVSFDFGEEQGAYVPSDAQKITFQPDTSIGWISLLNANRVPEYLGHDYWEHVIVSEMLPHVRILSNDSKQRLSAIFHPGGSRYDVAEVKVEYAEEYKPYDRVSEHTSFVTESGIHLGMTQKELTSLKGPAHNITSQGATVLHYRIDDYEHSEFLQKYNMPIYYANYTFEKGRLIAFEFGFEYP
ncbi:MAG: hypothetical protein F6K11_03245 [Leptolyngbya sp. SIO3F4]|nr:hypothetical protein [Leptolyngbya sp. SIO3F4]